MNESSVKRTRVAAEGPSRSGRPRREFASEVEERILEAAAKIFMDRGYEGATIDEIAEEARAGKPTIYARFPNKHALFCTVVARKVQENMNWEGFAVTGSTTEERLTALGMALLERTLAPDSIQLMRSTIAEARRFPDLASSVYRMIRERGNESIVRLLAEFAKSDATAGLPSFAPDHLRETAHRFAELMIVPITMRALFGEDMTIVRAAIGPAVKEAVAFFLAAVRSGEIR